MELLEEFSDGDFYFVRIGEELDDLETTGNFWYNPFGLEISRCVLLPMWGKIILVDTVVMYARYQEC